MSEGKSMSYVAICNEGHWVAAHVKDSSNAAAEVQDWVSRGYDVDTRPTEWVRSGGEMCTCEEIVG